MAAAAGVGCSLPTERGAKAMLHIHVHPWERCLSSWEWDQSSGRLGLVGAGGWFLKCLGTPWDGLWSWMGELGCPEHDPLRLSLGIVLIPKAQAKLPGRKSDGRGWFGSAGGERESRRCPSLAGALARRNPSPRPSLAEAGTLCLSFSAPKSGNGEAWDGSAVGWMENWRFQAGFCSVHDKRGRGAVS